MPDVVVALSVAIAKNEGIPTATAFIVDNASALQTKRDVSLIFRGGFIKLPFSRTTYQTIV